MPLVSNVSHQKVNAYDLASQWLTALGWPNTPSNQRALAAWFMAESSHNGTTLNVAGNNPLNITTSTGNYRLVGSHRIAVYDSPQAGIDAFRNLIGSPNHNYPGIQSAFKTKSGNGQSVISAIINSGWVTGGNGPSYNHTVNGQRRNLLQDVYNGISNGNSNATLASLSLSDWQAKLASIGVPNDPNHKFTHDEAIAILTKLYGINPDHIPPDFISAFEGKTVAETLGGASTTLIPPVGPQDLGPGIANIASGILNAIFGKLVPVGALIGGGVMSLFGLYLITKEATSGGQAESLVSPVPIFIRERA